MKSYTQTAVIVTIPHFHLATVRKRPVPPPHLRMNLAYNRPVGIIRDSDKMRIHWWPDGTIDMVSVGGGHLVFYPRPTLKDALAHSLSGDNKNCFFKFEEGGDVYARWYGMNYFWSADTEVTTWEQGEEVVPYFADDGWHFPTDAELEEGGPDSSEEYYQACGCCPFNNYTTDSEPEEEEYDSPSSCCGRYFCQCRECADTIPKD